jgi:peptide/nickel transport system substrate-binding protein
MTRGLGIALAVAVFALFVGGLVALGSGSDDGGGSGASATGAPLLRVGTSANLPTLDLTRNNEAFTLSSLGLEQLLQVSADGKLQPWLAREVRHPDPITYVYRLREGVKFWNGNEMTSADVAHSLNYARRPKSLSASFYASVKSIEPRGRHAVVVKLKRPDAGWKYVPAQFYAQIFEKRFQDEHGADMGKPGTLIMGTGPYKFESLDPTRGAELSANPRYWAGRVPIDRISVKRYSDETSMALAFRSREIDVAPGLTRPQAFASTSGAKLATGPSCATGFFSMNTQVAPWDDIHVRRAVAHALNREDIVKAWGGFATPITTLIPPVQLRTLASEASVSALLDSLPSYPYSVERARAEMAESSHAEGFSMTLLSLKGWGHDHSSVNQVIAEQLRAIGIRAQVKEFDAAEYLEATGPPPDKRPTLFVFSGCISPDPGFYTYVLGSQNSETGFNSASYAPPEVDEMIAAAIATENGDERLELYGRLLERLAEDVPYVPLFVSDGTLAISSDFTWPGFMQAYYNRSWGFDIKPS